MLRERLKEETHTAHQKTESTVVRNVKSIQNEQDYITLLKSFYAYFNAVEKELSKHIDESVLPDIKNRRNSTDIKNDIIELGGDIENLPLAKVPQINNTLEALSAMYVLEGSIMGGPYIIKMLEKQGISRAFSFFSGYGQNSGQMLGAFVQVLERYGHNPETHSKSVEVANETFINFGEVFSAEKVA
ncbi:MAG: biliverdin-producing heme oxygenase [Chitinophagales bacterium]|nr:biliverdin-producing heme oxygenase [Chitinophagales bacterium]